MADWEEIKRLAADLQRVQISSTAHKLSERNCIEIVQKLINTGLLEVLYTTDGKEYLTPQQLEREIKDELFVRGGRINLVDLQQIINVDLSHIEGKVAEILKHDQNLVLIQGELIDREYLDRVAEEINETLQESGQVMIGELSKTFGLPADFLQEAIESRLGSIIHGKLDQLDQGVIFTDAFIARQSAKIRGVFSAITRPTSLSNLVVQFGFQEKLFYTVISDLLAKGRLSGTIQGRQDKAVFVPDIYSHTQNEWIDSFFKQNGYIEYDSVTRLGITDAKQFLKRRFKAQNPMYLPTCCVGKVIQDNVEATIDEALSTGSWVDVMPLLPSPFTPSDATQLLNGCLKSAQLHSSQVFCDSMVLSDNFIAECRGMFEELMKDKAEKDVAKCPALFAELSRKDVANLSGEKGGSKRDQKKEERKKKATVGSSGSKGGGGRGAREVKTQKSRDKKKDRYLHDDNVEEDTQKPVSEEIEFMSEEEIVQVLQKKITDCPEELLEELSQYLYRPLRRAYQEVARSVFSAGTGNKKRMSHSEVQDKINGLYANAKLFQRGIKQFNDDVQAQLSRHLLRTVCTDMVNLVLNFLAADQMIAVADEASLTPESRLKLISKFPEKIKSQLIKLNSSLGSKDTDEFFIQFDVAAGPDYCEFMIKKLDKKRERQIMIEHRCALEEQLRHELEPAMTLHLSAVLLFYHYTNCLVHAPGRCVPQIISFLGDHMTQEQHTKLSQYQGLVIKKIYGGSAVKEEESEENGNENDKNGEARVENEAEENVGVGKSAACLLDERIQEIKTLALEIRSKDEPQR